MYFEKYKKYKKLYLNLKGGSAEPPFNKYDEGNSSTKLVLDLIRLRTNEARELNKKGVLKETIFDMLNTDPSIDLEFLFITHFSFFINPENFNIFERLALSQNERLQNKVREIISRNNTYDLSYFHQVLKYGRLRLINHTISFEDFLKQIILLFVIVRIDINDNSVYTSREYGNTITTTTQELINTLKDVRLNESQLDELKKYGLYIID
jgi:hypothetical protein